MSYLDDADKAVATADEALSTWDKIDKRLTAGDSTERPTVDETLTLARDLAAALRATRQQLVELKIISEDIALNGDG